MISNRRFWTANCSWAKFTGIFALCISSARPPFKKNSIATFENSMIDLSASVDVYIDPPHPRLQADRNPIGSVCNESGSFRGFCFGSSCFHFSSSFLVWIPCNQISTACCLQSWLNEKKLEELKSDQGLSVWQRPLSKRTYVASPATLRGYYGPIHIESDSDCCWLVHWPSHCASDITLPATRSTRWPAEKSAPRETDWNLWKMQESKNELVPQEKAELEHDSVRQRSQGLFISFHWISLVILFIFLIIVM